MANVLKETFHLKPMKRRTSPAAAGSATSGSNAGRLDIVLQGAVSKKTKLVWKTMHMDKAVTFGVVKPADSLSKLAKYHMGKYLWRTYYDAKVSGKLTKLAIKKTEIIEECHDLLDALSKIEELLRQTTCMPATLNEAFNEYEGLLRLDDEPVGDEVKAIRSAFRDICTPTFQKFRTSQKGDVAEFVRKQVLGVLHMAQYWNKALSLRESRLSTSGAFGRYLESGINAAKRYQFPAGLKPYKVVTDGAEDKNALADRDPGPSMTPKKVTVPCSVSKAYRMFEIEQVLHDFDMNDFEESLKSRVRGSITESGCGMFDVSMQWKRLRGVVDLSDKRDGLAEKLPYILVNGFLSLIYQAFDFALSFLLNTSYYVPSRHLKWQWRADKKDPGRRYSAQELKKLVEPNTWDDVFNEVKKINPAKSFGTRLGLGLRFIVDFFVLDPTLAVLAVLGQGFARVIADCTLYCTAYEGGVRNGNAIDNALGLECIARREGGFSDEYLRQKQYLYRPKNNPIALVLYNVMGYISALIRLSLSLFACLPCFIGLRKFKNAGLQLKSSLMQFAVLGVQSWKGIATAVNFVGGALVGLITQRIPRFLGWLFINQILARIAPKFTLSKAQRCSTKMDHAAEKTASVFRGCTGLKGAREALAVLP